MKIIGAHVSTEGGVENAPLEARSIGATGFALFTRNQRAWHSRPLAAESIAAFRDRCAAAAYGPGSILAHDSYLINLGAPDAGVLAQSREAFVDELHRCEQLGIAMLNFHPGSHKKLMTDDECLDRVAESINLGLAGTQDVAAVIELTAGQGSNVGRTLEQVARIIDGVSDRRRVGVCVDTAHVFAAGCDLAAPGGYEAFMTDLDRVIGLGFLRGMHLNDTRMALGSRKDRHASLGDGELGWDLFERIARDPRTEDIPLILETPDPDLWPAEIARLAAAARGGST